jgi:hypothetical protein
MELTSMAERVEQWAVRYHYAGKSHVSEFDDEDSARLAARAHGRHPDCHADVLRRVMVLPAWTTVTTFNESTLGVDQ